MVEGQEDVTWEQWVALARTAETAGLQALFRSDHYLSVHGRAERGSLDAWGTLCALAAVTDRLRLGTLVSPVTFRHPSELAKLVVTADHVSGGRVELGLGAGWHEPEHRAYGFPFPPTDQRFELLAEQLEVIHRQWSERGFAFHGRHYRIESLDALPEPVQRPHPTLIVGGGAGPRSAGLAARWADEYNVVFATVDQCRERRVRVERAFEEAGRDPAQLRFSLMTGCVVGTDHDEVERRARAVMDRTGQSGDSGAWMRENVRRLVIGTLDEATDQLAALSEAGVDRVMLQHLGHTDLEMVELLGRELAPRLS